MPVPPEVGPVRLTVKELVIVIVVTPLFDGSAILVAVSETVDGAKRFCGAV